MPRASLLPRPASLIFSDTFIAMMRLPSDMRTPSSSGGAPSTSASGMLNSAITCSAEGPDIGSDCATAAGPKRRTLASRIWGTSSSISPLRTAKSQTLSSNAPAAFGFSARPRMMSSVRRRRSWFCPMISAVRLLQ